MTTPSSLSVFFPAYNEEKNIRDTVLKAKKVLDKLKIIWEIIVIDDGSKDDTLKEANRAAGQDRRIRVVHQDNGGYGAALSKGFSEAKYDWVVYTDSDGQFDFGEIEKLLALTGNSDAVWGFRKNRNDPWYRSLFAFVWRTSSRLLFNLKLRDVDCGFKMFRRTVLLRFLPLKSKRGAMANVELAVMVQANGGTISQVGVSHYPRVFGKPTGYDPQVIVSSYLDLLNLWQRIVFPLLISSKKTITALFLLVLTLVTFVSWILPFTYWPEMLNWPFFMLSGWLPYKDITIVHTPILLWLIEGAYWIFGAKLWVLHSIGTFFILTISALVFYITLKISRNCLAGFLSVILFAFLCFALEGNTVWFESLLPLFLLPAFWFLILFEESGKNYRLVLSGLLFGLALWTKQTTAYLFPAILFVMVYFRIVKHFSFKELTKAVVIMAAPIILITILGVFILGHLGVLSDFFYWGVRFVFFKPFVAKGNDGYVLLPVLHQMAILTIYAGLGFILAVRSKTFASYLAFAFMLFSLLFSFPRFDYFHLIPSFAFLALLFGLVAIKENKLFLLVCLSIFIIMGLSVFLRSTLSYHTFIESDVLKVADKVKNDYQRKSIFLLNGPDQVYFLSGRLPAFKPWLAQLPWYFSYYRPQKYLRDFQSNEPDVILYQPYLSKAIQGLGAYVPLPLYDYARSHYSEATRSGDIIILEKNK